MVKTCRFILAFVCLFLVSTSGISQSTEQLEKKIESIQKDIKLAEKLLKETSKDKEASMNRINLLQAQISQRENLVKTYQSQINTINKEIQKNRNRIESLEKDLNLMRKEYSNLILLNYRNKGKANSLLFIFSSEDFNQALRRVRYIKELNGLAKDKIEEIESTQTEIKEQLEKNEKKREEKEAVLEKEKEERNALKKERDELNKDLASIRKKEKQIRQGIKDKEKQAKELKKQINKIIEEELRKAREREEVAKKNNTKPIDYNLSDDFAKNKGKLPYPVEKGIIVTKYGLTSHPTLHKVKTNSDGVEISTTKGARARCVFDGVVCGITGQGNNNVILIRHGLYFTLYANLDRIYVKMGENVSTGQEIGRVHTNANSGETILQFEIWHENKKSLNPSLWIKK